jgi:hypothetical protein
MRERGYQGRPTGAGTRFPPRPRGAGERARGEGACPRSTQGNWTSNAASVLLAVHQTCMDAPSPRPSPPMGERGNRGSGRLSEEQRLWPAVRGTEALAGCPRNTGSGRLSEEQRPRPGFRLLASPPRLLDALPPPCVQRFPPRPRGAGERARGEGAWGSSLHPGKLDEQRRERAAGRSPNVYVRPLSPALSPDGGEGEQRLWPAVRGTEALAVLEPALPSDQEEGDFVLTAAAGSPLLSR